LKKIRATTWVLALLTIMYFITYLDRVNVSTAAAGFEKEFGLSKTEIGLVFSMFAYPYLLFQIIGGWVSDRFGPKRTLLACGLIWSLATILTGFSTGLISMLIARVLLGLGEGSTFPAATAAMSRWVAKEKRGFAQGLTHAGARIGNAIAPTIIIALMATYNWRMAFYVCGALSLAWVALLSISFTDNPKDHARVTAEELAALPQVATKTNKVAWRSLFKHMLPVTLVYFCYGWTLWLFLSWIPQYFLHNYSLDLKKSAIFASSVFFAGVVGDTLGGIISDKILHKTGNLKYARSYMVAACMACALASLVPLLFNHNLYISLACLSAGFFFAELCIGPMWAIPMDIAPHYSGTASGMMNTGSALAAIISPVVSGYLIDSTGNWEIPFIGSMVLMGAGVLLTFRMRPGQQFHAA
jgi:ACS family glucarate transporter-like MFS transporter